MTQFGDFEPLCHTVPSYPWCNLFYRQVLNYNASVFDDVSANMTTAPVGINPECGIPRAGYNGSLANVANIIACALSIVLVASLIVFASRRKAAVGHIEFRQFLILYFLTLPFQLVTTGSFLEQGSTALTAVTAVHAGLVAATFFALLGNAILSTQVVEDGTPAVLTVFNFFVLAFFVATTYIALDIGFSFNHVFGPSVPQQDLQSIPLFVLTSIWPGAAAVLYMIIMLYVVFDILHEVGPAWYYVSAMVLFVLSQLDFFLLSKVICKGTSERVDGTFVATFLETAAVSMLYLGWRRITEDTWDEDVLYPAGHLRTQTSLPIAKTTDPIDTVEVPLSLSIEPVTHHHRYKPQHIPTSHHPFPQPAPSHHYQHVSGSHHQITPSDHLTPPPTHHS